MKDKFHIVKENHLWKVYNNSQKEICIAKTMHLHQMISKLQTAYWATQMHEKSIDYILSEDEMMFGVESPGGN